MLVLHPQLGDWGLLAFERLDKIVAAGYAELAASIAEWWAETQAKCGPGRAPADGDDQAAI